jgi:hypothetical protein
MEYTLDQIADMQQALVTQGKINPNLDGKFTNSQILKGKYSDDSNPVTAPWVTMPNGGFPFNLGQTITTPGNDGLFHDVIKMVVPNGNDGVIKKLLNFYNGAGYVNGSGQLIWRIMRNGQAVRNYDNIVIQLGTDAATADTQIRVYSNDVIQFQIMNVLITGAVNQILCYFGGWYYPAKTMGGIS